MGALTLLVGVKIHTVSLENNLALSSKTENNANPVEIHIYVHDDTCTKIKNIHNSPQMDTTWKKNNKLGFLKSMIVMQ